MRFCLLSRQIKVQGHHSKVMVDPPHFDDLEEYILKSNILVQEIVPRTDVVFPSTDRRRSADLYEFRCRARRI